MDQEKIFLTLLGMALVTFIPRLLPLLILVNKSLPSSITKWLSYVPAAVLAAMLFPAIMTRDGQFTMWSHNLFLWASLPTILVAWRTKSMFAAVIAGMIIVAVCRFWLGW